MSGYLCRVRIDLTNVPKNNRNDMFFETFKHFDNGIIVLEQNTSTVNIFPQETIMHFSEILSKAKPCDSYFNKRLLHAVRRKTIFVFNKGEVSVLEENIFTTFEESIEKEFRSCVQLEYDSIQGRLHSKNVGERVARKGAPRVARKVSARRKLGTNSLMPHSVQTYMTGDNEYTANSYSRQVCIANVTQPPRHPSFAEHNSREASFATRKQFEFFNIKALADAGFYYIGEGTIIRCYFCGTELANLSSKDDPFLKHVQKLPSCEHLLSHLGPEMIAEYQARIRNETINSQQTNGSVGDPSWSASDQIRSRQYQAYSIRLASFTRWPSDITQTPKQLADAGFYYTGLQDVVRCFACDGGFKNWDPADDPWTEHARWFSHCPFVKRVKGQEFIHIVQITEESDEVEDEIVSSTFQPNNPSSSNEFNSQLDQENAEDVLETDAAKHVLTEGYSKDIVARAINELLNKGNLDYTSKDIMELIHERKDKDERTTAAHGKMNPSTMPGPSSQTNDSKRTLIEENQRLRQSMQCVECREAKREILLLPCTHLCLCSNCSDKSSICPLCYKKIREKIKTYII